jgi:glycosyltransferase involved in cell wall biosynthesis
MPKRIFYISPGTDLGGGEVSLLTLIKNLDRSRFTPIICAYDNGRFVERAKELDCPVYVLTYSNVLSQLRFVFKLSHLIKAEKSDLVHVNTLDIRAGIATRLAGRKLVGHLRVIFPTTWVDRAFVKIAHKTISVSNAVRDHFCQAENTPPNAFETIYNAVDIQTITTSNLREELNLTSETKIIGVVGRIDPWKGMEIFIKAAAQVIQKQPDTHFVIAGTPGPNAEEQAYHQHLKEQVVTFGLTHNFHFLGYRSDALSLIKQFTTLVVPSRILQTPNGIKTEGFGRVAAEGLAMQTPVVASRVGGLSEIIEHKKSGLLFAESDHNELASHIIGLLENKSLCQKLSQTGYTRFIEHFSVDRHLLNIQSLYDQLLDT